MRNLRQRGGLRGHFLFGSTSDNSAKKEALAGGVLTVGTSRHPRGIHCNKKAGNDVLQNLCSGRTPKNETWDSAVSHRVWRKSVESELRP